MSSMLLTLINIDNSDEAFFCCYLSCYVLYCSYYSMVFTSAVAVIVNVAAYTRSLDEFYRAILSIVSPQKQQ